MSEGKRYVSGSVTERVPAGGGYDEWFEIRKAPKFGATLDLSATGTDAERRDELFASMIADWSLTDEAGQKLPINAVTVRNLDLDLAAPIMPYLEAYANAFLVLRSLTMKGS